MSADTSHIRYLCPFCDWDGPSPKSVRSHVTSSDEGPHKGVNGYTMDKTIDTTEDPRRLPMIERVEKAGDEFDEPLTKDDADEVVEAAKDADDDMAEHLSRYMVLRVWMDNGRDVSIHGPVSLYYDDLTSPQQKAMQYMYHTDMAYTQISSHIEQSKNYCSKLRKKYSYMLQPQFVEDSLKNDVPDDVETDDGDSSDEEHQTLQVEMSNPTLHALQKADVDHEVEIHVEEDDFDAITKLVKAGYEGVAEKLFKE